MINEVDIFFDESLNILTHKINDITNIKSTINNEINNLITKNYKVVTNYWKLITFNKFINIIESNYLESLDRSYISTFISKIRVEVSLKEKNHLMFLDKLCREIVADIISLKSILNKNITYFNNIIDKFRKNISYDKCNYEQQMFFMENESKIIETFTFNEKRLIVIIAELNKFENKILLLSHSNDKAEQLVILHNFIIFLQEIHDFIFFTKRTFYQEEVISTLAKIDQEKISADIFKHLDYEAIYNFINNNGQLPICQLDKKKLDFPYMTKILARYYFLLTDINAEEIDNIAKIFNTEIKIEDTLAIENTKKWNAIVINELIAHIEQEYNNFLNIIHLNFDESQKKLYALIVSNNFNDINNYHDLSVLQEIVNVAIEEIDHKIGLINFNILLFNKILRKWQLNFNLDDCFSKQKAIIKEKQDKLSSFLVPNFKVLHSINNKLKNFKGTIPEEYDQRNIGNTINILKELNNYLIVIKNYFFLSKINFSRQLGRTKAEKKSYFKPKN